MSLGTYIRRRALRKSKSHSDRRGRRPLGMESLETRTLMSVAQPVVNASPDEQYVLELVNRMRMNPAAELALLKQDPDVQATLSYFKVNQSILQSQWNQLQSAPPLAWSNSLGSGARNHSQHMKNIDKQDHAANPTFYENVFAFADSLIYGHAAFAIDWGNTSTGIQSRTGHRNAIMDSNNRVVGIGIVEDSNPSTSVGPLLITERFNPSSSVYMTGVVYNDVVNQNQFFDVGEQMAGIGVSATNTATNVTYTTYTGAGGGYTLAIPPGNYRYGIGGSFSTKSGGGGRFNLGGFVTIASQNVKIDGRMRDLDIVMPGQKTPLDVSPFAPFAESTDRVIDRTDAAVYITGEVNTPGDVDLYQLNAVAGTQYVFESSLGTLADTTLAVVDAAGNQVAFDDDGGEGLASRIEWTSPDNGTYSIEVSAFNGAQTGSYQLNVAAREATTDDADSVAVDKLYRQVLGRGPEPEALVYHSNRLSQGASLGDVAAGIFESPERLDPIIAGMYREFLLREAEPAGVAYYREIWQRDGGPENVRSNIISSPEFYQSAGGTDAAWVGQLYDRLLGRSATADEIAYHVRRLSAGVARSDIVLGFARSPENYGNLIVAWYVNYLSRQPRQDELDGLTSQMIAGSTERDIQMGIINSAEYRNAPIAT